MKNQAEMIGELIRKARQEKKLTVRALAKALDLSPGAISNLENGKVQKIRPEHREKLLEVLGVEITDEPKTVDELGFVFEKLGIEPIQQDLFRRAFSGTVAKRHQEGEESSVEQLERKVTSVLCVMPNPTVLKLRSPEVTAAMNTIGVRPEQSHRDDLDCVLDEIESIVFKGVQIDERTGAILEQDAFLNRIANEHRVGVFVVDDDAAKREALKSQLIADGFLNLAMEVDEIAHKPKYFGVVTSSPESGSRYKSCVLLAETTPEKTFRKGFTFAHELAHVLVDPNLKKGNVVHRNYGADGQSPLEWFVDRVAARLLFPSFWVKPKIAELKVRGCLPFLNADLVAAFRKDYAPHVSYMAVVNALVNYWPIPVLYMEAKQYRFKSLFEPGEWLTSALQVRCFCGNKAAEQMGLQVPYLHVVPENTALFKFYQAYKNGKPTDTLDCCAEEPLSLWLKNEPNLLEDPLLSMSFSGSKWDDGSLVVRAFIIPKEELKKYPKTSPD